MEEKTLTLKIIDIAYNGVSKEQIIRVEDSYTFLFNKSSFSPTKVYSSKTEREVLENIILGLNSSLRESIPFESLVEENAFFYNGQLYLPEDSISNLKLEKKGIGELYYYEKFVPATSELRGASGEYANPYIILTQFESLK